MPRSVRSLLDALDALPRAAGPERLVALDHLAARVITAVGRFCDQPAALVPAQRALLLLGGRPGAGDDALFGLLTALSEIDADLDAEGRGDRGGFSRLLQSALEAGEVEAAPRLCAEDLPAELQPIAGRLEQLAGDLEAIDDLAHATQTAAALPAGAAVATFLFDEVAHREELDEAERITQLQGWAVHRRALGKLPSLLPFGAGRDELDDEVVELAAAAGVSRPLALWIIATRAAGRPGAPLDRADRSSLRALLKAAGLWPLEVFEAARS